ncbi:hypothetical protein A2526_03420 [candidate division WOR-1 bacterium RIFOXYD2_FULL_36_8]|uniref:Molecular chaperone Skp n=1 Tax=candidate division WOR-1 bacterium RIFOXYB2_FULL_36_35 TaxID=1802578 RepID=A0A1F4S7N2_UNCSA|nr:MAG: hypothetical protein A2230_04900 [candidate division WOR-1 bacterium RIFOXYA2_FULL_36_21]OGC15743.1 MAG: hypothetical protein A2290_05325 [candidate division WOR-1 bacterium RIFOXYB2_FULL_36_35]OGC21098.1 MAG: hypothetical protein A2282_03655 [candidate division WOR-1 bacterium RIFOXYA12_FULL_36_13]OGC41478.1 MAG: hypothetical protein A2526_03420 [candidate division WOR-1 bacterium RIFOXYD2_FULL_36_8]
MFKKMFAALFLSMFIVSVGFAETSSIGYIDVQKVFSNYKETTKAQKELQKKEEDFKKLFEDSQNKLKEAEDKGKSKNELDKMTKDLEKKLEPKRTELLKLNEQLTSKLQGNIVDSVENVAKKLGIDIVLDKQVLIVGGMDITDMVIKDLNK